MNTPNKDDPSEQSDSDDWDLQMKADAEAGRLDKLANEALDDLRKGRCTDL